MSVINRRHDALRRSLYLLTLAGLIVVIIDWVYPELLPRHADVIGELTLIGGAVGRLITFKGGRFAAFRDRLTEDEVRSINDINRSSWIPFFLCATFLIVSWALHFDIDLFGRAHRHVIIAAILAAVIFGSVCFRLKMKEAKIYKRFDFPSTNPDDHL